MGREHDGKTSQAGSCQRGGLPLSSEGESKEKEKGKAKEKEKKKEKAIFLAAMRQPLSPAPNCLLDYLPSSRNWPSAHTLCTEG